MKLTKEEYILHKIKCLIKLKKKDNEKIDPETLEELIKMWEFDCELEEMHPGTMTMDVSKIEKVKVSSIKAKPINEFNL